MELRTCNLPKGKYQQMTQINEFLVFSQKENLQFVQTTEKAQNLHFVQIMDN